MRQYVFPLILLLAVAGGASADENWPQWRGPNLNGAVEASNLPVTWSETENIVWRIPLPAWSGSTPIIWGDRIYLTSPEKGEHPVNANLGGGRRRRVRDPGGDSINLLCLNRDDGALIWKSEIGRGNRFQMKQNMASPSPVTDGERLWVMTGNGELVCFDMDGKEIWRRNIQLDYGNFVINHGYANSPLLYKDRLIVAVLHGFRNNDAPSYLLAIDKTTGKTIWRAKRDHSAVRESPDSYATPQMITYADGRTEVVINGADIVTGHDIETGKEMWRVDGLNPRNNPMNRIIPSCVIVGDLIFAPTRVKPLLAIRGGGRGNVTKTHVAWKAEVTGPDVPSPVSDGKYLWMVLDRGFFACLDVKTGKPMYQQQRLPTGTYSSSPILADGKIYATSEGGTTTVIEASPEFKVLSINELNDPYTLSSPIVSGERIYLRTAEYLYCIGDTETKS